MSFSDNLIDKESAAKDLDILAGGLASGAGFGLGALATDIIVRGGNVGSVSRMRARALKRLGNKLTDLGNWVAKHPRVGAFVAAPLAVTPIVGAIAGGISVAGKQRKEASALGAISCSIAARAFMRDY